MKLKDLYKIIQHICNIYKNYLEKENLTIKEKLNKINQEANEINLLIKEENEIHNGKNIYLDWKKKKHKFIKYETFKTKLFNAIKGVNLFKLNDEDEVIVDEVTSCWLIKNNLDKYVLE